MPYVSEELFQRLPRWSDQEPPSITVTPFPTMEDISYRDTNIEADVELIQKIVGVVRSTRADYTIPNKTKTELYLEINCSNTRQVVSSMEFSVAIVTLKLQMSVCQSLKYLTIYINHYSLHSTFLTTSPLPSPQS